MPEAPLKVEWADSAPVAVEWADPAPVSVTWSPPPPKKTRWRSALDEMLAGTAQVWEETKAMAKAMPSPEEAAEAAVAIPKGLMDSDLGAAFSPALDVGMKALGAIGAPFHAAIAGPYAATGGPIEAALGASPEQIEHNRNTFEIGAGTIIPAGAMAKAKALSMAEAAASPGRGYKAPSVSQTAPESIPAAGAGVEAGKTPVVDPTTGQTILKNQPPDPQIQAKYLKTLKDKGIDILDPEDVKRHVLEREGLAAEQVDLVVDPAMPISKTEAVPEGVKVQIEPGTPGEIATRIEHEVGNHAPEKLGLRGAPVEDNNALILEGLEKERATFATPVEPGQGLPGPHVPDDVNPALEALHGARKGLAGITKREKIAFHDSENINLTGTLKKDLRETFREIEAKPETKTIRMSELDVENYGKKLVQSARAIREAYRNPNLQDPISQLGLKMTMDEFGDATSRWTALRFGFGRGTGRFGQALDEALVGLPAKEVQEVEQILRSSGIMLEGSQLARKALWTEGWKALLKGETLEGVGDLTRFASMNLFSTLSFTVDAMTSVYRHSGQAGGYLAKDAYWMAKGHPNFPNFGGFIRAMKKADGRNTLPSEIMSELGGAVAGESAPGRLPIKAMARSLGDVPGDMAKNWKAGEGIGGKIKGALKTEVGPNVDLGTGIATHRQGVVSTAFDLGTMGPAYAKRFVDTKSGTFAAKWKINAMADEAANAAGLKGSARKQFVRDFIANPPDAIAEAKVTAKRLGLQGDELEAFLKEAQATDVRSEVTRVGQELQWKVPVHKLEQQFNDSLITRWFFTAFPSWPSQFVRGMGDMLGVRWSTYKRMAAAGWKAEDVMEHFGRTATGWGGVYFANKFYDSVDFDSMEIVVPGIGRYRIGSLDPLPEVFGLLAVIKGDKAKAAAALKHSSIPFASPLAKFSGIFTPVVRNFQTFAEKGTINMNKTQKDMTAMVNSLIPAQAVMAAFKSLLDPVSRSGVGANIPFISEDLPAKIDATTGEEQIMRQRLQIPYTDLVVKGPNIAGAPIRGAARETDAVYELLDYYNPESIIRQGVRTPYADTPITDIPEDQQNEYKVLFGRKRWQLLTEKRHGALAGKFSNGELMHPKGSKEYERTRIKIKALDSAAAKYALGQMRKKYGSGKPKRRESFFESSGASLGYDPIGADKAPTPLSIDWMEQDEDLNEPTPQ